MASAKPIEKIYLLQKKAIRFIKNVKYNEHTAPLFKDLSILNIKDVTDLEMAKFMFKLNNNELPIEISRLLVRCNEIHNYQTRHNVDPVHIKPEFCLLYTSDAADD